MKKRLVACLLALVFVMSCFPLEILAVEDADSSTASTTALIYAESTYCVIGKTVDVDICILQNPGIAGAKFSVSFDEGLTLIAADEKGGVFEALDYTAPKNLVNSCPFNWDTLDQVASEDGRIMTLTFAVADNAVAGDQFDINISYQYGDIYDSDLNSLSVTMVGGVLDVIDYLPGDVNGDGVINGIDVTLIRRYNADWDVTLQPGKVVCAAHSLSAVTAKAATCTEAGHTAYWQCTACKACFSDEAAGKEIALSDTVIYAKGHTEVVDEAVAPTYDATGLTEGAHCSVCNTVLTAQQIVPQLQASYHSITYRNLNGATSPSKTRYAEHEGLLDLPAVSAPGYKFLGWYTASKDGTLIDYIPAGDTTDYVLYAHWEAIKYKITYTGVQDGFDNGIKEYTVEDGNIYLSKDPEWKHLIFTGWEDQLGKLSYAENGIPMIKSGTTGDIFLKATWKARQNIFNKAEKQYNSSAFNEEDGKYYFFYHLGDLSNVLLQAKEGKGRDHTGVMTTLTTSKSVTVSEEYAKGYATAISNAVKNSFEATLSSELAASLAVAVGSSATVGATVGCKFAQATASATTSTEITAGASWSSTVGTSSSTSSETSKTDEVTSSISFMKESTFTEEESKTLTADDPRGKYYFLAAGTFEIYSVVVYDPIANELQFSVYGKHVDTYPMILYSPDATDVKVDPEIDEIPYDIYEEDIIKTVTNSMFVFYETGHSDVVVDKKKARSNDSFSLSSEEALPVNDFYSRYGYVFDGWELRDVNGNLLVDKIEDGEKVALLSRYAKDCDCRVFKLVARWKNVMRITLDGQEADTSANVSEIYVHVGKGVFADYEGNKPIEKIETPKKTGYVFAGYYIEVTNNTFSDASGTTCIINSDGTFADAFKNDGYSYFKDDAEINALWIRGKYKITLSPEGGASGSAAIYSQYKTGIYTDSQCTIPVDAQNKIVMPKRTGYTFLGYYDQSGTMRIDCNGGINEYLLGDFDKITSDVTLFARWKANCYKIQYNKNGGAGTMAFSEHTYNVDKALSANGFTRVGYTFIGWNTKKDGTGKTYAGGETVKNLTAVDQGTVTLFAQWENGDYRVKYDANGGAGKMTSSAHKYDVDKALTANAFTRTGYTFSGWNTKADGTGTAYANGATVKNLTSTSGATVTLYAQWKANTYTITFSNPHGAAVSSMKVTYNSTVTLPTPKHRNAEYYQFDQWTYNGKKVDRVFTYTYASSITLVAGETSWRQKYSQYTYIKDRTGLENIANDLSGKYMLICDIDLSQNEWTKLGTFTGELNGDGHAINGLKRFAGIPNGGEEYGLFERLEGATVLNIAFANVDILVNGGDKNYYKFGALAGSAHASNISGIIVSGSIKIDSSGSGEAWTGGVAGAIYE